MPVAKPWPEASVTGVQSDAWHVRPKQSCPQAPQFCGSVAVSTHSPPHAVASFGQTHFPAWQNTHTLPQAPQFAGSLLVSTHMFPHWTAGAWQVAHVPVLVASPPLEPHAPTASPEAAVARRREENRSFMGSFAVRGLPCRYIGPDVAASTIAHTARGYGRQRRNAGHAGDARRRRPGLRRFVDLATLAGMTPETLWPRLMSNVTEHRPVTE
jgi:hypothetical protein